MIAYAIIMLLIMNNALLNSTIDSTLESIIKAEKAGADTTELVDRFNKVLFDNCQECTEIKDSLLEIENEARYLKNQSIEKNNFNAIIAYIVYAPIAALVATLSSLYIYEKWRVYKKGYKDEK